MRLPRLVAMPVVLALLVAGCTSSAPDPSASPTGATSAQCATSPEPASIEGWGAPDTAPTVFPVFATSYIACGPSRILFSFLDADNQVVSGPDRTASVAFFDLGTEPKTPVASADGEFIWAVEGERGVYAVNVELPTAGTYGAEFTTQAPDGPAEIIRMTFDVHDSSPVVQVGDTAPASDTPTLDDVGGDVSKLSTDTDPVEAFYTTSVADALAAGKPFVLVFATPKFCTSAQCGPTLDKVKPIADAHPEVTFINVEPYQLEDVEGQLQPVLDANGNLQSTAATDEWGLLTEPWIFAVDGTGTVKASYDIIASDAEMETAIQAITAGS
jgi:hypothetical protein